MINDLTFTLWFGRLLERHRLKVSEGYRVWLKSELNAYGLSTGEFERITRQLLITEEPLRGNPSRAWWTSRMDHPPQQVQEGEYGTDERGYTTFYPGPSRPQPYHPPCSESENRYYSALAKHAIDGTPLSLELKALAVRQLTAMTKGSMTPEQEEYALTLSNLIDRKAPEGAVGDMALAS